MSDDLIRRAEHWERGGTVENPKALLREMIAEIKRLREPVKVKQPWSHVWPHR